jgi:3-isopropylmalate/(R)-2-methylmalate dehydratase large subunit
MNEDKIPAGKYCVSSSNRNYKGRQGAGSRTFLASPIMTAVAAIEGKIVDVRSYL